MTKQRPPIRVQGGKYFLASWIINSFPKDYHEMTFCEPFCAGASVFLNKDPSKEEVLSDSDCGIIHIFKALRDEPQEFITRLKRTRYTERAFKMALNREEKGFDDYVDHAVNEFILRRMSTGGLKRSFAASDPTTWRNTVQFLPETAERVAGATLLCSDFKEVIKVWDEEDTLFYLDPPHLHSNRSEEEPVSDFEMTVEDHMDLLQILKTIRGKVVISGYSSPLYNRSLKEGWRCRRNTGKKKGSRTECIWLNF